MTVLDRKELEVLRALLIALEGATDCGLLDRLAIITPPVSINAFCDAVKELIEAEDC